MHDRSTLPRRRAMFLAALLLSLSGCRTSIHASYADSTAPTYAARAPLAVTGPIELSLQDNNQNKELYFTLLYPTTGRNYPVIVFSHGAGGSPKSYIKLLTYWAQHGYVVVAPAHADDQGGGLLKLKAALDSTEDPAARVNRLEDVTFLIDSLKGLVEVEPGLKGKMDFNRLGVGGHSYGAYVAMVIGGTKVDLTNSGTMKTYKDPRVRSVLLMSPQGVGRMGLNETSWSSFHIPMLLMTGSLDKPFGNAGSSSRTDPYRLAPSGHKYEIYIDGANHLSFCDFMSNLPERRRLFAPAQSSSLTQREMYQYVEAGSLAFWDATLKNSATAREYLRSNTMEQSSGGVVHPSHG